MVDSFDYDNYDLENRKRTGKTLSDIGFVICDEALFQVYDNIQTAAEDFIGSSLTWQYFFHVWQIYGICPFANAMVFEVPKADGLGDLIITNYNSSDGENLVTINHGAVQTINYATIPTDYAVKNVELTIEQVIEAASKDKITNDNLKDYVSLTHNATAKTITFTASAAVPQSGGSTATVVCNLITDNVVTPIVLLIDLPA